MKRAWKVSIGVGLAVLLTVPTGIAFARGGGSHSSYSSHSSHSTGGSVYVHGYTRKDGTYVSGYYRSSPDGNPYNNWSYPGNTNPYTGKTATGDPTTYLIDHGYLTGGSGYIPSTSTPTKSSSTSSSSGFAAKSSTPTFTPPKVPTYSSPTYVTPKVTTPTYTVPMYNTGTTTKTYTPTGNAVTNVPTYTPATAPNLQQMEQQSKDNLINQLVMLYGLKKEDLEPKTFSQLLDLSSRYSLSKSIQQRTGKYYDSNLYTFSQLLNISVGK